MSTEQEELQSLLLAMREDWDRRALENARHFVANENEQWGDEDFVASGERAVRDFILTDMENICQGQDPRKMSILEIGCGVGRMTRTLARVFGEIHAVDVSGEMIRIASKELAAVPNITFYQNNGTDLTVVPPITFDFALSTIVFQHIPSHEVIANYFKEVHRVLRDGALFKCEVQGG